MNWIDNLQRSLDYIEENLDNGISIKKAASIACCSEYDYQRMFGFITNVSLGEYIRRRRLTLAAYELQKEGATVMEVGLKYGYSSPTAFTRAFSKTHGITPGAARKQGASFKAYPRMTFNISVNTDGPLIYRLEEKPAFRLVGVKEQMRHDRVHAFERAPKMWDELYKDGTLDKLKTISNDESLGVLSAINYNNDGTLDFYVTVPTEKPAPEGMLELNIDAGLWAIFSLWGRAATRPTKLRIFYEWFPSSGYVYRDGPNIEWFEDDEHEEESCLIELWIPIK